MTTRAPCRKLAMRPMLPADAPLLAEIFRASIEELTADDYSEAQQEAWAAAADDEEDFGARLAGELTLVATHGGSPVGFAALAETIRIDMLYVHPAAAGQGAGAMLCDALEKLAAARGSKELTVEASDTARGFFERRGFAAKTRNTVSLAGEWLANTTMVKPLAAAAAEARIMKRGDMPFQRHWLYYLVLKYAVIALRSWSRSTPPIGSIGVEHKMARETFLGLRTHHIVDCGDRHPDRGGAGVELLSLVKVAMPRERLYLFDTTLRDGAQTNGVDFTLADKLAIARMLDELGVDYVEAGYPGANPTDTSLFAEQRPLRAKVTAFGMTRRPGRSASNDPGLAALLAAEADAICFVAKSWDYHVRVALETTEEENLASIRDSVRAAKAKGREVLLDCEHFFDGYKANPAYALACAKAAYDEGARWVVLCDTNGGTLPHEVEQIVGEVCKQIPGDHVGIHAHNDTEQAVANSFAAVRAGARQIQGTLNGLGERCGNANLVSIIPTLKLKAEYAEQIRDRRVGRGARPSRARVARARRTAQSRRQPPRALCRRERLRHQGRHPCFRDHEGAGDLRARRARSASATSASSWSPIRPAARTCWPSSTASASRSTRTIRASRACLTRSRSARRSATPTRRRTPRSSCWRGGCSARCRAISTWRNSTSMSSSASTPRASASP